MSGSTQGDQSRWVVAELSPEERKFEVRELTDETPIVRYVRLSTLFLYLSNRAFIPSLECLRGLDRKEGQADFEYSDEAFRNFLTSLFNRYENIFADKVRRTERSPVVKMVQFRVRASRWRDELAKRRAIWCWNLFDEPSNAMWELYGSKGVAIKSTVGHLKEALAKCGCPRRLIVPVRYDQPHSLSSAPKKFNPQDKATWPSWFLRPYAFKVPAYRYEQEIRFVFGVNPAITELQGGVLIKLDSKVLLQDISVSDLIPGDEADLIRDLFVKFKSGKLRSQKYPRKEWWKSLNVMGPSFTAVDDYPELFPDLTEYR